MNYGDHNYKLQVAPVELVVSSELSCAVRLARHSQIASARHVERVESCRVESSRAKWNLGFTIRFPPEQAASATYTFRRYLEYFDISFSMYL